MSINLDCEYVALCGVQGKGWSVSNPPPLRVDTPSLNWDPADVTVPPVPLIPAGGDPMSLMISAIMPELAVPLTEAVATTRAREEQFSANLAGARSAYQSTDQAGGQEIQAVSSQQLPAANPATTGSAGAGSSTGQFGQLMGTAMQTAGQAVQAPMQMMGMAASLPQGLMQGAQGAVQQVGQLSEQFETTEVDNGNDDDAAEASVDSREHDEDDAGPGSAGMERAPTDSGSPEPIRPLDL